jgi:hypothetical protein
VGERREVVISSWIEASVDLGKAFGLGSIWIGYGLE